MAQLEGKVALVTGGSRGIGAATAQRLARDGATVALTYNASPERARQVVEAIRQEGGTAEAFQADAADAASAIGLVDRVIERFGRLDILVNNAGVYATAPTGEATDEHFATVIDVNVRGVFALVRAAARHMGEGGRIVNIGSVNALTGMPQNGVYSASKAAVGAMTRVWAKEFGGQGITVNTLLPGPINTEMNPSDPDQNPMAPTITSFTALGRYGTADEIAGTVAFLASGDAAYITGADVVVDGGMTA